MRQVPKNIILGITGGIAAYKCGELIRLLKKHDATVRVIMTKNAQEFVTPLTMQTLSGNTVYTEMFCQQITTNLEHIALARWADLILIAPASANFIARLAHGFADDLLATVCLATTAPIALCPAMNKAMWHAPATKNNIAILQSRNIAIIGPADGEQACGEIGAGRMLEPTEIVPSVIALFEQPVLAKRKIIITAGPTKEAIDPVRFISNHSSGKMGYALAEAALAAGAQVTLISGPTTLSCNPKITKIAVTTAAEMYVAVMQQIDNCDIFIATAAVADFRPKRIEPQKIKKDQNFLILELEKNPDIVATVAKLPKKPFVVGFAAETENLAENAWNKLLTKNLDLIVANTVGTNLGFNNDYNELLILQKNSAPIKLARDTKINLARELIKIIIANYP